MILILEFVMTLPSERVRKMIDLAELKLNGDAGHRAGSCGPSVRYIVHSDRGGTTH
jgi:hypothetical protein